MSDGFANDTATLEKALRRLEALTAALQNVTDNRARDTARELLELVLDLHGLALARMSAVIAFEDNGLALTERLIDDPHIRAILLLHGLHPHDAELRLREAIGRMQAQWNARGFGVDLLSVGPTSARARLYKNGSSEPVDLLRREVEDILVDAAPDLDDIAIELDGAGLFKAEALAM